MYRMRENRKRIHMCVCITHTHTHIYIYIYTYTYINIYINRLYGRKEERTATAEERGEKEGQPRGQHVAVLPACLARLAPVPPTCPPAVRSSSTVRASYSKKYQYSSTK